MYTLTRDVGTILYIMYSIIVHNYVISSTSSRLTFLRNVVFGYSGQNIGFPIRARSLQTPSIYHQPAKFAAVDAPELCHHAR